MSRIHWAFQQALCRQPRADELETIFNLLYKHVTARRADEEAAALLQVGLAPAPAGVDLTDDSPHPTTVLVARPADAAPVRAGTTGRAAPEG